MICNVNRLRRPADPAAEDTTMKKVLTYMRENGHPSYDREINELQCQFTEIQAEAGPHGPDCTITQGALDKIDKEIWAVAMSAWDRYEDWRTDAMGDWS